MSDEFSRLKRLAKSLIPRFPKGKERYYTPSDARMMINELGLQMSPEVLKYLVSRDAILDDFINSIYQLEQEIRKRVVTEFGTIDHEYEPRVYVEGQVVGFSVTYKNEEIVFAEYEME